MKSSIEKLIGSLVRIDWIWRLLEGKIFPLIYYAQNARRQNSLPWKTPAPISDIFSDMAVRNGIFAGMKYPKMASRGSSLFPKLLGSYERELGPLLERICRNQYTRIVDVGCAEGYYAVGLAMRISTAEVFAFDTDAKAIALCRKMAEINGVSQRMTTGSFCDGKTLSTLACTERALIISDCEGYEKALFTKDNVSAFSRHELLIEVHDFIDIEISSRLRKLFEPTHNIEVYTSIDDIKKTQIYSYRELDGLSLAEKNQVLREGRPAIMDWFYMTPKHPEGPRA